MTNCTTAPPPRSSSVCVPLTLDGRIQASALNLVLETGIPGMVTSWPLAKRIALGCVVQLPVPYSIVPAPDVETVAATSTFRPRFVAVGPVVNVGCAVIVKLPRVVAGVAVAMFAGRTSNL